MAAHGLDQPCAPAQTGLIEQIAHVYRQVIQKISCSECASVRTSCDLLRTAQVPEVIVLGFKHDHADPAYEALHNAVLEAARNGRFPLVTELAEFGAMQPWMSNSKNIKGMESPIPHALISSYLLQRQLIDDMNSSASLIASVASAAISSNPLFRKAYEDLRQDTKEPCPVCFRVIDRVAAEFQKHGNSTDIRAAEEELRASNETMRIRFLDRLHKQIIQIAKEKYHDRLPPQELFPIESTPDAERFGLYEGGHYRPGSIYDKITVDLRNRDFAGSISDSMCELGASASHVVVMLGFAHADGVIDLLKGLSGGRVKTRYFKAWDVSDMETLMSLIPKIK